MLGALTEIGMKKEDKRKVYTDVNEDTPGFKYDADKARMDLIPVLPLMSLAELYRIGAEKYRDRNWETGGMEFSRVYGAALRHIYAWWNGEEFDPENGQHHLDAAVFNLFALREYVIRGKGEDDRPLHENEAHPTTQEFLEELRAIRQTILKEKGHSDT